MGIAKKIIYKATRLESAGSPLAPASTQGSEKIFAGDLEALGWLVPVSASRGPRASPRGPRQEPCEVCTPNGPNTPRFDSFQHLGKAPTKTQGAVSVSFRSTLCEKSRATDLTCRAVLLETQHVLAVS